MPLASNCKRLLIWNIDSPGDAIWITPSLLANRKSFPSAKVTLVCNKNVKELFELNANIDHLISIAIKYFYGWTLFFSGNLFLKKLAEEDFDLMFILEAGSRPADHARIFYQKSKAKYCAATNVGILKDLTEYVAPRNRKENPRYWPDLYLDLVRHFGIEIKKAKNEIFSSDSEKIRVEMDEFTKKIIAS
jgi:ADP-heptose:LPS heptosyltransferase